MPFRVRPQVVHGMVWLKFLIREELYMIILILRLIVLGMLFPGAKKKLQLALWVLIFVSAFVEMVEPFGDEPFGDVHFLVSFR